MNIRTLGAKIVYVAALLVAVSSASAQDAPLQSPLQSYDVELIIFRVSRPNSSPENWALSDATLKLPATPSEDEVTAVPTSPTAPAPPVAPVPPAATTDTSFPALNTAQFRMNGVEESLRKGRTYQPLAHIGWTQPGYPVGASPKFSIGNYLPGFLPEGVVLSGEVSLSRGARLLHLMLDLSYQAPDGQRYLLRETRRMKSTEKHYLDHPYFGVIALITPRG